MSSIKFSYRIVYKPGDYSDSKTYIHSVSDFDLQIVENVFTNSSAVANAAVDSIRAAIPCLYASVLDQINKIETEVFLTNEDPDEWGMEEVDDSWEITDSFRIELLTAQLC